ncbi:MAG TPA: hypothetical protein VF039_10330 [Longimicrobiales bacterium]
MRLARTGLLALGFCLLPAALGAQQGDPATRIEATLGAAAEAGIPVALLESKVREGRAKGIPEARIAAAVEARFSALARARTALARAGAEGVVAADLAVAADALQAGVDEASMVDVMTRVPRERRAVATAVLTELVELGLASDVALERVKTAVRQGGEALVNLPSQVSERARANARGRVNVDVGPPAEVEAGARGRIDRPRGRPNN